MKSSKFSWRFEKLLKMYSTKKVNFDLVIQRKDDIWDKQRQSTLIHSVLSDYPIPAVFASKEGKTYQFLDGKQRLTTIFAYMQDEFSLHTSTLPIDDVEIAGLRFSELSDDMQAKIATYSIDVIIIEEATQEEIEELFYRLNNGMPLRQIETTRAILGSRVLKFVESVASMDFFANKVNVSKNARKRYVDQELVLQILALLENEETGFSGKELQSFVKELRKLKIRDTLKARMDNACFYLNEAFPKKEKFLRKIHVPMLFKLVLDLMHKGELETVTPKEFGEFTKSFFENVPEAYKEATRSGSARKENVQKRLSIMSAEFNKFMKQKAKQKRYDYLKEDEAV